MSSPVASNKKASQTPARRVPKAATAAAAALVEEAENAVPFPSQKATEDDEDLSCKQQATKQETRKEDTAPAKQEEVKKEKEEEEDSGLGGLEARMESFTIEPRNAASPALPPSGNRWDPEPNGYSREELRRFSSPWKKKTFADDSDSHLESQVTNLESQVTNLDFHDFPSDNYSPPSHTRSHILFGYDMVSALERTCSHCGGTGVMGDTLVQRDGVWKCRFNCAEAGW